MLKSGPFSRQPAPPEPAESPYETTNHFLERAFDQLELDDAYKLLLITPSREIRAVSDVSGGIFNGDGIDMDQLFEHLKRGGSLQNFPKTENVTNEDLLGIECDILAPAALGHVLTKATAEDVRAKYILEGANGPCTIAGDAVLRRRDIQVIPDIWANAGGVTVSYFEWTQNIQQLSWDESDVNSKLERYMVRAHTAIRQTMQDYAATMRDAAFIYTIRAVKQATDTRGFD